MAKISDERIESIRKFCETHPKCDAARRFNLSLATIHRHTVGIAWKKRNNKNLKP